MPTCPECDAGIERPEATGIAVAQFFDDEETDVSTSRQEHLQLECPDCEVILGYLAVAAATGE